MSQLNVKQVPWYDAMPISLWALLFVISLALAVGFNAGKFYGAKQKQGRRKRLNSITEASKLLQEEDYSDVEDERHFKMVLVVRTDLDMTKGKAAAQCCHACLAAYVATAKISPANIKNWVAQGQPKITLKCQSQDELLRLYTEAKGQGLVAEYIQDAGRTQIAPGSLTVLAIGPAASERIDVITKHLKLY